MTEPRDLANAIRALSMDAVQQANSGHPGAPMGMADIAEVLWNRFLVHNPGNPAWPNRDRFVLSNGHGSMLLYSLLHLSGYDLPIEELRRFRQLHSQTPGHPEYGETPGVETTTGPLGQGLANAVGMAIAERALAARFNRPDHELIDHHTYAFAGDGCLMEGISHEVCSLAGTLGLGKLIVFYDDNGISIDGEVEGWFTDDTPGRFAAYGWQVIPALDGHDAAAVAAAIERLMQHLGMVDGVSPAPLASRAGWVEEMQPVFYASRWLRAEHGGLLISEVALGEMVDVGQRLGRIIDPLSNQVFEVRSSLSGRMLGMAENQQVLPGFALYHVGLMTTEREAIIQNEAIDSELIEDDETRGRPREPSADPEPEDG